MIHRYIFLACLAALSFPTVSWAHGSDQPGPHGGTIQMPGAFHTEVVAESRQHQVYLLDIQFKDPVTLDSQVEVVLVQGNKKIPLECKSEKTAFSCDLPDTATLDRGVLRIAAEREGEKGVEVEYPLPLKFAGTGHAP